MTPNISGFVDLCSYHMNGEPILFCNGNIQASYDMNTRIDYKYNFLFPETRREINKAIKANWNMFDVEETNNFYYPNTNMFSMSNAEKNIKGYLLILKKRYRR